MDWQLDAAISKALGAEEWIQAELKTAKKTYEFSNADQNLQSGKRQPFPVDVDASPEGVRLECAGRNGRRLTVLLSPSLLNEILVAYGSVAAKAGQNFPAPEAARALMRAQTSIVNRDKSQFGSE